MGGGEVWDKRRNGRRGTLGGEEGWKEEKDEIGGRMGGGRH